MNRRSLGALSVGGHVSLTPHQGRALVAGVLGAPATRGGDSGDADHGGSGTPSHVLDWSGYSDEAVVHNAAIAGDAQGLHADDSAAPTTAADLSRLSLVDILAAILDVRVIDRTRSEAQESAEKAAEIADDSTDRRRDFAMLVSHDATTPTRLTVGVSLLDLEDATVANTTETMRYGFTFFMDDDTDPTKRTTEVYSFTFDTAVDPDAERDYLAYEAHGLLGAEPRALNNTFGEGQNLSDWEVKDVGAGLLTGFMPAALGEDDDDAGLTIRRSFATHAALHVSYPAAADAFAVEAINGVDIAGGVGSAWTLLAETVYSITVSKTTTCTIQRTGTAQPDLTFSLDVGESLVICVEIDASLRAEYKLDPPAAAQEDGYAHTYTTALENHMLLKLVASDGTESDATSFSIGVEDGALGAVQARPAGDHQWDQMQARGVRRVARERLRAAAREPAAVAALLPAADDDAAVAYMFEHFEWPAAGNPFFGFDSARPVEPVVLASTAPVAELELLVEGAPSIDGNAGDLLVAGQRVLLKDQSDRAENGVYVVASAAAGLPERDADFVGGSVVDALVRVTGGSVNQGKSFRCTVSTAIGFEVGVSPIEFEEYVRWPLVQRVEENFLLPDQSKTLLKTVQDGYHRYTFAQSDAISVDETSGHMHVTGARSAYMDPPISLKLRPVSADDSTWNTATLQHARTIDVGNVETWEYNGG